MLPWCTLFALVGAAAASKSKQHPNALRRSQTSEGGADVSSGAAVRVQLLILIFTQRSNEARRRTQRDTWLGHRWQRGEVKTPPPAAVAAASWRYVYVMARDGMEKADEVDRVVGDAVTLSAVRESYANLVYKTLEAVRWALHHVPFGVLLKTDDDSIVHVGRAALWLHLKGRQDALLLPSLYAGRVFNDSQVIRHNFTRADLLHPEWYPPDFTKWGVPYEALPTSALVGGYYYPPYCSGGGYMLGAHAARRIVAAYDVRAAARVPVVKVEDAFVGLLARERAVRPLDISELVQDPPAGRKQGPELFGGLILVHRVHDFAKAFQWLIYPVKTAFEREGRRRARGGAKTRRRLHVTRETER